MSNNKEFLSKIISDKARFYLFDFHVHSPASYDVRTGENYTSLSDEEKAFLTEIPESLSKNHVEYEVEVLKKFPVDKYYDLLVKHRNRIVEMEEISDGEDWAFIAITDHNICNYASAVSKYAWGKENLKKNRLVVFPGIELDVCFIEPSFGDEVNIHIILIYAPQTATHQIYTSIREASNQSWEFGDTLNVENLSEFIKNVRNHKEYPAICIAAHISSSKGIRAETKKCILNYLDTAILRTKAELEGAEDNNRKIELCEKLDEFTAEKSNEDVISSEILNMLGKCGFDALQVRGRKDEPYYYQIHRYKKELGRAVAIVCSDSHAIKNIFMCKDDDGCDNVMSYIKINNISTSISAQRMFEEVRNKGLRYGETRVSFTKPDQIPFWIDGIEITLDAKDGSKFWVGSNTTATGHKDVEPLKENFILPLSRNLNCIIGGRGSGKSASIEAISFLMNNSQFLKKENWKSDWYTRADATLKGCKVRICWKLLAEKSLPKRVLFINGFFERNNKHLPLTYTNIDDKEVLPSSILMPTVDIFRVHDIEDTAKSDGLRKLFDSICGEEVHNLSIEISNAIIDLESHRRGLINIATKIIKIVEDNSPLREYARRKYEFDKVNKKEIKLQYEKIDQAANALSITNISSTMWNDIVDKFDIKSRRKEIENFALKIKETIYNKNNGKDELRPYCFELEKLIKKFDGNYPNLSDNALGIFKPVDELNRGLEYINIEFIDIKNKIDDVIQEGNEELASQGIPQGSQDRKAKKEAFEESQKQYVEYCDYFKQFGKLYNKREDIRTILKSKCNRRSELRKISSDYINMMLLKNLDSSIIKIETNAQPMKDKEMFKNWFENKFDWTGCKYRDARIKSLIEKNGISPEVLKKILMNPKEPNVTLLIVDKPTVALGKIGEDDVKGLIKNNTIWVKLDPEISEETYGTEFFNKLPRKIRNGIYAFNCKGINMKTIILDSILELDEIILDDIPIVRLNDRPKESTLNKELSKLSPGQRCSAILPIILLTGNNPLIIDQPEDNLDNRLIRQVIVNVLASIKLKRQVIIATHNANLPVLGDAEQIIALRAIEDDMCEFEAVGSLDNGEVVKNITEIMEGGREAFQFRQTIYQSYWQDGAELPDSTIV